MKKTLILITLIISGMLSSVPLAQASTLKAGTSGSEIRILQSELQSLGYSTGSLDGIYGRNTKAAVEAFQRDAHLSVDGIAGSQTQNALNKAYTRNKTTEGILGRARSLLGVPYVWGGTTPSGFDCSGFTRYVFEKQGLQLPRTSQAQFGIGVPVSFNNLRPGDLVFFNLTNGNKISHVGIYMGKGQFISATTSKGIAIYSFTPYWSKGYVGARRIY